MQGYDKCFDLLIKLTLLFGHKIWISGAMVTVTKMAAICDLSHSPKIAAIFSLRNPHFDLDQLSIMYAMT